MQGREVILKMPSNDAESEILYRRIHRNRKGSQRIGEFNKQNVFEGVIETVICESIIILIPFVLNLKLALIVLMGFGIVIFNLVGFRNKSWGQTIYRLVRMRSGRKSLKLRSVSDEANRNRHGYAREDGFIQKAGQYFSKEELEREDAGIIRKVYKALRPYIENIRDTFGL